jgi:hypothetical protein
MRTCSWQRAWLWVLCVGMLLYLSGCVTPKPRIAPPAGVYTCPAIVTLSDSRTDAAIFYTTDGSAPTPASTKYAAPFAVSATDTVQALAQAPGSKISSVATVSYTCAGVAASGFAAQMQQRFSMPQPKVLVRFEDLAPSDPNYAAAQAITPYLNRQVLCPRCMLPANFGPNQAVSRGASAVFFVTYLMAQNKLQLLNDQDANRALANVADASSLQDLKRRYIATAVQNGILPLQQGNTIHEATPLSPSEMSTVLQNIRNKFNVPPAGLQ